MTSFSQKYGYKPIKSIVQIEAIDDELRIGLWNELDSFYWSRADSFHTLGFKTNKNVLWLLKQIWSDYFKLPIDTIGNDWSAAYKHIRDYYFSCSWNEVYDFIEFVANHAYYDAVNKQFREECNEVLKREVSGYRFIGDRIAQITAEEEVAEIEEALRVSTALKPVAIHLNSALEKLSDRKSPDYRNSIKESISAVEAISSQIAGKDKAELAEALKILSGKIQLHTALQQGFIKLYGYTSDAEGIRHALLEETKTKLDFEDAKFMLVACSAFINYLKVKASKAGIDLT
jgi:hypothetical protein